MRNPNIFQRYHGTDTISEKEILARGFSVWYVSYMMCDDTNPNGAQDRERRCLRVVMHYDSYESVDFKNYEK